MTNSQNIENPDTSMDLEKPGDKINHDSIFQPDSMAMKMLHLSGFIYV
ncbi:MAG: hypothetical protein QNJ63_24660 [Calothrix sp. MO_192.B10]|nr:hypothetical protein [Calothrix sp. MO_192.B10]